jgi:hypothetical protein
MTGIEQHLISGHSPKESYSFWVGRENEMQRVSENSDNFVLVLRETIDGNPRLKLVLSSSTDAYLTQVLAALHDHCANGGTVMPRNWSLPNEKPRQPVSG